MDNAIRQLAGAHARAILSTREARQRHLSSQVTKYPDNQLDFITDVLGVDLTNQQESVVQAVQKYRRVAIKSGHGVGKTRVLAAIVAAFLHIHEYSKVITTSPGGTQIRSGLWQHIRYLAAHAKKPLLSQPFTTRWEIAPEWFALGYKPREGKTANIQGYHAPWMLLVIDEAAEIEQIILEALESLMTNENAFIVLMGNPTNVTNPLYDAFTSQSSLWHRITLLPRESPNVLAGREVIPGLVTQQWIDEAIQEHGEGSPFVQARVEAEFPKGVGSAYVPVDWIERAQARTDEPDPTVPLEIGIDVARMGSDSSVFVARQEGYCYPPVMWSKHDLMGLVQLILGEVASLRERIAGEWGVTPPEVGLVKVDIGGLGAGVVDRLNELREEGTFPCQEVVGVNFGGRANETEKFVNVTDESWWALREAFHLDAIHGTIDPKLIEELTSRRTAPASGKTHPHLESKETYRRRHRKSPDTADAYALAFWQPDVLEEGGGVPVGVPHLSVWNRDQGLWRILDRERGVG